MPGGTVAASKDEPLTMSELIGAVETVIASGSRDAAVAMLPELNRLKEKVLRLRSRGLDIGLSSAVLTVAYLAGVYEEFKDLA